MPSTYTTNGGIELPANGEQSGTWGETVNDNMAIIDRLTNGVGAISLSGTTHTLTTTDGTLSDGQYNVLVLGGSPSGTNTITISPNDGEHVYVVKNASGQTATFTQGSGANVSVLNNTTKIIYADGAGAGAAVVDITGALDLGSLIIAGTSVTATAAELNLLDGSIAGTVVNSKAVIYGAAGQVEATTVEFDNLSGTGAVSVTNILDEDNMASDSATALATQQSIKAYVDAQVGTVDTLAEILAIGNTTGATDIAVDSAQKVQFRDAAIYINSSVDGQLDIVADTEIQIAATTVDLNGALDVSGTALVTGVLTTTAATVHTGGITMPNNAKAIFGTGSSLEIYGDGSHSYISDQGTGRLKIFATDLEINNAGNTANYIQAFDGGAVTLYHNNAAKLATTATGIDVTGTVTATGTSVFASLDISGDIDVDGTTNLDVVDIDGAVDMASTLQVTGTANFSDRIGSTYVYPTDAGGQTGGVTNYFWKMGRMTLAGPAAAEIKLYGFQGYGQGDQIAGTNIIQLRGSNSATVLEGCFHAIGDPGIGIQEMRYVPIGSSVFDLYVKLGPYFSLSTTVVSGGAWVPEWTDTGSGSNPASSVDIPPQYALILGSTLPMHANLTEVAFNDYSNDVDFRVESDTSTHMLFVDASGGYVTVGRETNLGSSVFTVQSNNNAGLAIGYGTGTNEYRRLYHHSSGLYFESSTNQAYLNASGVWTDASDITYKKDIEDIDYGIETVKKLKPRKYKMKSDDTDQIGFVAQELVEQVPEIVSEKDGILGVAYGQLTAVLTKAIQEQQATIEALTARITALES
jgi:hypothetical protein